MCFALKHSGVCTKKITPPPDAADAAKQNPYMFSSPLFSPLVRYVVDIFLRNFVLIAAGKKEQAARHAPSLLAQEGRGRWIIRADMLLLYPQTERENVQFNLTTMLSKLVHLIRGKKYPSYGGGRKGGPREVCDVCEDAQWGEKGGGRQRLLFGRLPSPSRPLPRSLAWPQSPPHAKAGGGGGRRKFMTPDFDKLA